MSISDDTHAGGNRRYTDNQLSDRSQDTMAMIVIIMATKKAVRLECGKSQFNVTPYSRIIMCTIDKYKVEPCLGQQPRKRTRLASEHPEVFTNKGGVFDEVVEDPEIIGNCGALEINKISLIKVIRPRIKAVQLTVRLLPRIPVKCETHRIRSCSRDGLFQAW